MAVKWYHCVLALSRAFRTSSCSLPMINIQPLFLNLLLQDEQGWMIHPLVSASRDWVCGGWSFEYQIHNNFFSFFLFKLGLSPPASFTKWFDYRDSLPKDHNPSQIRPFCVARWYKRTTTEYKWTAVDGASPWAVRCLGLCQWPKLTRYIACIQACFWSNYCII